MSTGLKLALAAAIAGGTTVTADWLVRSAPDPGDLVSLKASAFAYRRAGEFLSDSVPVNPPLVTVRFDRPVEIMRAHVSRADYQRCVEASACKPVDMPAGDDAASLPVVGVSWFDATAYAEWLSRETGYRYRLPTDAEWAFAAASLFRDNTIVDDTDAANPAERWIATYESEAAAGSKLDPDPQPFGTYGVNENGLVDVAGNVWDWTSTCFTRQNSTGAGRISEVESCGVRVVEGAHRAYLSDFVRSPRGGACSAGTPPSNLGIRLVRDRGGFIERVVRALRRLTTSS